MPFAEYVPLQWKVSKKEIEDGGETDHSPVHRFAYRLAPDHGAIDITPLDRDGKAIEHLKKRGIYFVKDDFLFVRYALDGGPRPPRVFTSELGSKTAILILRRGPLTLPP